MTNALLIPKPPVLAKSAGLVRPLPMGPLDLIGDIHGQMDALRDLMRHLGYDAQGGHPDGRQLVFLGDLVDRGPDSAGVMELVMAMVSRGAAYCILGNHELNILVDKRAEHNAWFFASDPLEPGRKAMGDERYQRLLAFMKSLPLAMERDDLRVVHAAWDDPSIAMLRMEHDALQVYNNHHNRILDELDADGIVEKLHRDLELQNKNPIKLISSGPEEPADEPFMANGKLQKLARVRWWKDYRDQAFCAFGHYWRNAPDDFQKGSNLFEGYEAHHVLGAGAAICIDYSVGARQQTKGLTRLAALRWPERELVFDDGQVKAIESR